MCLQNQWQVWVKSVFSLSMTFFKMEVRLGPLEQANLTEPFHIHVVRGNDRSNEAVCRHLQNKTYGNLQIIKAGKEVKLPRDCRNFF